MYLRSCIKRMLDIGLAVGIDNPINWDLEARTVMCYANEHRLPAQLFINIEDAMKGATLLGGLRATYERIAVILGLSPETSDFCGECFTRRVAPVMAEVAIARSGCND